MGRALKLPKIGFSDFAWKVGWKTPNKLSCDLDNAAAMRFFSRAPRNHCDFLRFFRRFSGDSSVASAEKLAISHFAIWNRSDFSAIAIFWGAKRIRALPTFSRSHPALLEKRPTPAWPQKASLRTLLGFLGASMHLADSDRVSPNTPPLLPARFGSLAFAIKNRHFRGECSRILARTARKYSKFWVFACVPNPGKQSIWRQCPPSSGKQSTNKLPNRPVFTHVHPP